jgi:dipeptidyl-peptidase 4
MTVPRLSRTSQLCAFAVRAASCLLPLVLLGGGLPAAGQEAKPPAQARPRTEAERLTVDQVLADGTFGRIPTQAAWSPDGRRLSYLWEDGKGQALWAVDAATGKVELLARLADLQAGAKAGESFAIDEYRWSPRGDALALLSGGDLYLYPLKSRQLRRLTETPEAEEEAEFSPDGSRLAFVRDFDLHLIDLATGRETALTRDGSENAFLNGITDWVYWEEIWGRDATGFWWSPDGSRIAYYRFDEAPVGTVPLVDETASSLPAAEVSTGAASEAASPPSVIAARYPKLNLQKYPKAGEPNPRVRFGILELATGTTVWLRPGGAEDDYLARLAWAADGRSVLIQHLNRDQTRLTLLRCQSADGACAPVLAEEHPTWVNLGDDFQPLPDGRFLWGSEASGWRRLALHEADGRKVRDLSPDGWSVTSLNGVTADGWVVFSGFATTGMGPADRQVLRARLDGSVVESLTVRPGWHSAQVAPATGFWLQTWNDADNPLRKSIRTLEGKETAARLPYAAPSYDPAQLPKWEFLFVPGADGARLPARLLKPAGFDPARRYPVIVYHYGGPASQVVENRWDTRGRTAWHKLMAARGFVVFSLDNTSSLFFGKAGEDRDYLRFGEVNLAAQLAGVEYLKGLPWVDAGRIGLWGWSGGGTHTLYCLFSRPGVWRAGVAGAPVTDWTLYDAIWTERYLDRPQDNPEGYRLSSPLTFAAQLKDHLLLVHGTADDNVHAQNSSVLARRFLDAGIPFEQAVYPGEKHALRTAASRHFYGRMTEFFERTLAPASGEDVEVEDVEIRTEP